MPLLDHRNEDVVRRSRIVSFKPLKSLKHTWMRRGKLRL